MEFSSKENSSFQNELRFRDKFQTAIRTNYSKIINEFVESPHNLNYFINELYKAGVYDGRTKVNLLDSKNRQQMAEKLFEIVSLSTAAAMRTFIRLFKTHSKNIYVDIIYHDYNNARNDVAESVFFGLLVNIPLGISNNLKICITRKLHHWTVKKNLRVHLHRMVKTVVRCKIRVRK
jgi:hypothetical protein